MFFVHVKILIGWYSLIRFIRFFRKSLLHNTPIRIYLTAVTASLTGAPTAHAILSFHIDPPIDAAPEPVSSPWIIAITALASSGATIIISIGLQNETITPEQWNRTSPLVRAHARSIGTFAYLGEFASPSM